MTSPASSELLPPHRAWLAVAALLLLLLLPDLVWLGMPHTGPILASALVFPVLLLAALFALCGRRLWIACAVLLPFAVLAPVEAYYIATYRRPTPPEVIGTILSTNRQEAVEFLGALLVPLVLVTLAALVLAALATRWSYRARLGWNHRSRWYVLLVVVMAPLLSAVLVGVLASGSTAERMQKSEKLLTTLSAPINDSYPFGMAERLASYYREWSTVHAVVVQLKDFRFHARRTSGSAIGRRQVYVLVIGESSRVDHWQLFGYSRQTTPELVKVPNLVAIPDMVASWSMSIAAIPLMLTRKPITANYLNVWKEASILRAMEEAGFETWWISNQQPLGQFDSMVAIYADEAQHRIYLNHAAAERGGSYDEILLKPLQDALASSQQDQFIVLHMMGSHPYYDLRYPAAFSKFQPVLADKTSHVPDFLRMINSYDNTILYSDHVLARIIATLQDSGAVSALWFSSDHGENLPSATCDHWGHGLGTRMDLRVPAFVWYSDAYAAAFPQRVQSLRANALQPVLSADAFESLVDMAGIDMPAREPSWSLFNPQWRFRKRIVNSIFQLDFDQSGTDGTACDLVIPLRKS